MKTEKAGKKGRLAKKKLKGAKISTKKAEAKQKGMNSEGF